MSKKRNRDPLASNCRDEKNQKYVIGSNESWYLKAQTNVENLSEEQRSEIQRCNSNKRYEIEKIKANIELYRKPAIAYSSSLIDEEGIFKSRREAIRYLFILHGSIKKELWKWSGIIQIIMDKLIIPKTSIQLVKKICSEILISQENNITYN